MIDRRSFLLGLFAAMGTATVAEAKPGAVDRRGCHSKPRHCHSSSEIIRDGNRRYVPGHFWNKKRKKSKKRRR